MAAFEDAAQLPRADRVGPEAAERSLRLDDRDPEEIHPARLAQGGLEDGGGALTHAAADGGETASTPPRRSLSAMVPTRRAPDAPTE